MPSAYIGWAMRYRLYLNNQHKCKGIIIMRSSKDRTIEKKRRNKATKVQKTEASRRKRIANKAKREEIHAIDPDMKVVVINQKTFDKHGTEIEVMNGKIRAAKLDDEIVKATIDFCNQPADYDDAVVEYQEAIDNQIEKERLFGFKALTNRWRKKNEK